MTKSDIINLIHDECGLSKKDIALVVNNLLQEIEEAITSGESVKISGFGNFEVKTRGQKMGRNPKTGEEIIIAPRTALSFKASKLFKDEINE